MFGCRLGIGLLFASRASPIVMAAHVDHVYDDELVSASVEELVRILLKRRQCVKAKDRLVTQVLLTF